MGRKCSTYRGGERCTQGLSSLGSLVLGPVCVAEIRRYGISSPVFVAEIRRYGISSPVCVGRNTVRPEFDVYLLTSVYYQQLHIMQPVQLQLNVKINKTYNKKVKSNQIAHIFRCLYITKSHLDLSWVFLQYKILSTS
jgi:hypothetical protein